MGFFSTLLVVLGWIVAILFAGLVALFVYSRVKQSKRNSWAQPHGLAEEQLHKGAVDLARYSGRWYEIAALPNSFERDCLCSAATYTVNPGGKTISVLNSCQYEDNEVKEARAVAWTNNKDNTWLKVNFLPETILGSADRAKMWPFSIASADYWILHVDDNYSEALVGSPDKKYLWILSRSPTITKQEYVRLATIAKEKGYDVDALQLSCRLLLE